MQVVPKLSWYPKTNIVAYVVSIDNRYRYSMCEGGEITIGINTIKVIEVASDNVLIQDSTTGDQFSIPLISTKELRALKSIKE